MRVMLPRDTMRLYQTAARVWLTVAALSLLLPAAAGLEWWVPLHLLLLGAVSVAISGTMQNFVAALTATGSTPPLLVWMQFGTINAGGAAMALVKAWAYPVLARSDPLVRGSMRLWDPATASSDDPQERTGRHQR
jgi:hypothetical protein